MTTVDTENFGQLHARWYDRWFSTRDYSSEVDQLNRIFAAAGGNVGSVLDVGCGTARHLELMATAGVEVTGVDRSPGMVELAAERLAGFGSRARVVESDMATLELGRTYDAVTMMSWVIGYNVTDADLFATLAVVRRHLRPEGLLVFDVLDGSTLIRSGARGGFNVIEDGDAQFLRASTGVIHHAEQIYEIGTRMWLFEGDQVRTSAEETQLIRYFLPKEIELVLDTAGFTLLGSEPLAGTQVGPGREWSRLFWARRGREEVG
jgi:SAM-dependent methyltransferase